MVSTWKRAANRASLVTGRRGATAAMEALRDTYPPLFRRHARRPRLTRLLDASTSQTIIVTAPAGYGKTTLASEWVQGRDDVVWYRATSGSADVAAFSAGIADVVAPLVPGAGERLRQRLRVADTPERAARPLAEILSEDLEAWPSGAFLVIDDYHLVAGSAPVEEFMDRLLQLTPTLRVLVTSRRRPKWATARRILYGEITEIGRDQLAMTNEEAALVLERRSSEDVRQLVEQAEGWPALIGLAALASTDEIPAERVSEALFRYFAEEVVRQEPEDVSRFMLLASVPSAIDPATAEHVLQMENAEPFFERLVAEGLLEPIGDRFHFHPLVRSFLQRTIESEEPEIFAELTRRAIERAREEARWEEAFDLAIQAEEFDAAVEILEQATPDLLAAGQSELLGRWLDDCREFGLDHPGATLTRVELLIRQGRTAEAEPLARSLVERLAPDDTRVSRAWYLTGLALHLRSNEADALTCHLRSQEFATSPREESDALWGAYIAALELGISDASKYLTALEALNLPDPASRLRVATGRIGALMAAGSLRGVSEVFEPLIPLSEHARDPMVQSSFLARLADVQVLRGQYADALTFSSRAIRIAQDLQLDFAIGICLIPQVTAEVGLRMFSAARKTLAELSRITLSREDPYLEVARDVAHLKLKLSDPRHRFTHKRLPEHVWQKAHAAARAEYLSLRALDAASVGNSSEASRLSHQASELSTEITSRFNVKFASVIARGLESGWDRSTETAVAEVIRECSDAEAFESLVLACRADKHLVSAAGTEPTARALVVRALRRSGDHEILGHVGVSGQPFESDAVDLSLLLTPREQEVLGLLSRGMSNSAIAQELVISRSTVKVHVHHILEKLQVKTRLQAVLKAGYISPPRGN
jgi:ATP/maltotriose-dependent transcriptional regulator MalT